jgi:hypothetical protein
MHVLDLSQGATVLKLMSEYTYYNVQIYIAAFCMAGSHVSIKHDVVIRESLYRIVPVNEPREITYTHRVALIYYICTK